jgi:hypothetical protein
MPPFFINLLIASFPSFYLTVFSRSSQSRVGKLIYFHEMVNFAERISYGLRAIFGS